MIDSNTFTGMFYATLSGAVGLVVILVTFTIKVNTLMVRQTIILEELVKTVRKYEEKNDREHKEFRDELNEQYDKIKAGESFCKYAHADKPRLE